MPILYMMIGVPGSGKSYIAESLDKEAVIVSSDAIRAELFGSEEDQEHNAEVFEEVHRRVHSLLNKGINVIYDATNLSRKRRVGFLKQLSSKVYKTAIVVATDLEIILCQNAARERVVPEEVIMRMFKRMQLPRFDEGWDAIRYFQHVDNKSLFDSLQDCMGFDQDNPHHTLSLYEHMQSASDYVCEQCKKEGISGQDRKTVMMAALFHDVGKPICKTYQLWSGKIDNHAHYYNHAEVGAYIFACGVLRSLEDKIDYVAAIGLIQWHMEYFAMPPEKVHEKASLYYGRDFARMLDILHAGDVQAH